VHGHESYTGPNDCIGPSEPWRYCVPMPDTWSCMLSECC
jgi:hypothetical protein